MVYCHSLSMYSKENVTMTSWRINHMQKLQIKFCNADETGAGILEAHCSIAHYYANQIILLRQRIKLQKPLP